MATSLLMVARVDAETGVDFSSQVAPLLSKKCVGCHSATTNKGGLDLSHRDKALKGGETEPAIVPGQVDESYLLTRIHDGEMPPKGKGTPLTGEEVALLEQWIAAGAVWPEGAVLSELDFSTDARAGRDWWSLQPLATVAVPASEDAATGDHPIDRFIQAKLRAAGLSPSPRADRRTLIRRLSFDLIGLPPEAEEVEAFERDNDPLAYEKLVDRLLASPHYGERWARHWLDIAHYADTHGFERDQRRDHAWHYRDYVIRALNRDLPYNQFLREQIAGDVVAADDSESIAATGFLAAGPWDFVGQVETMSDTLKRMARADDLDDIVTQVITASMGLSINCARCHNHKLDPISQEEYYRLSAVFAGVRRGDRPLASDNANPRNKERAELQKRLNELDKQLLESGDGRLDLADVVGGGDGLGTGKPGAGIDPRNGQPIDVAAGFLAGIKPNAFSPVRGTGGGLIDGVFTPQGPGPVVISSDGITAADLPAAQGGAWDYIKLGPSLGSESSTADGVDYAAAGHTLLSMHANKGITFDLAALRKKAKSETLTLVATLAYGGATGRFRADFYIYVDGRQVLAERDIDRARGGIPISLTLPATSRFLTFIALEGKEGVAHDQIFLGDPRIVGADPHPGDGDAKTTEIARLREERESIVKRLATLSPPAVAQKVFGVVSQKNPEKIRVLMRGNTEAPGDEVSPGTLQCLEMLPSEIGDDGTPEGERRRLLAEWIVASRNPLTPRVWANRLWHYHFGQGIVNTPSDFGFGGDRPSHPELLDWLAGELIRGGWSTKAMHRLIVTSQTYQQVSRNRADGIAKDTSNRLLWRMNPQRLESEAIRDAVLSVTGKLNPAPFGPGFQDFKYVEAYAPEYTYVVHDSPALWRRSIYRFVVRSTPHEFLTTLDCPDPSSLAPKRMTTTTALQSLALLNNDFMIRQAGYLAERVRREPGDVAAQIDRAFRLVLQRKPNEAEAAAARRLVEEGDLFDLCRGLLNASEFIYVD